MTTWSSRIRDLQGTDLTLAEIAERIGLTPSAVGDLATGRTEEPRGDAAVKLHELHRERCGKERTERHRSKPADSGLHALTHDE